MVNKKLLIFVAIFITIPSLFYWVGYVASLANINTFMTPHINNLSDRYLILNLILPFIAYRINNLTILRDRFGETEDMLINRYVYRLSIFLMIAGLGRLILSIF